tara:strand:+ start:2276 stop:2656 length:381 start_codon:yes stop_codon:yes gene_type:complete
MSEVKTNKLTGTSTAKTVTVTVGSSATQSLEQGLIKCWIHANNAASIEDSLNTSSSVDDGTGQYTYNLSNAYNTVSYSNVCGNISTSAVFGIMWSYTTSQFRTRWYDTSGSYTDVDNAYSTAGDLA